MLPKLRPWLILGFIWVAYFHPMFLQPSGTLHFDYSDFLAEHLPGRVFLVREWRSAGELPLWNPYHFCGAPFVHDIQVGTFYPPYAATFLAPETAAGAIMSWSVALHLLAAAGFTFLYARSRGMGEAGGLVAAVGFAFSAKWCTHLFLAGHTITVGLAWLPLVLLGYESYIRTGRRRGILGGGIAFASLILGTHPQWTFYAGLFVAAWTLPRASRGRWLLGGIGIVAIAIALAAVQLLPTLEASRYSSRSAGMAASTTAIAGFSALLSQVVPSPAYFPALSWEWRGLFGLFSLAAAFAAPALNPSLRWPRLVLLAMLLFSFGGAAAVESWPGFSLFRSHPRMLLIATFPIAVLAGSTTDALLKSGWSEASRLALRRIGVFTAILCAAPSLGGAYLLMRGRTEPVWAEFVLFWSITAVGLVAVGFVLASNRMPSATRTSLWLAVLLLETLTPTFHFVAVKPQSERYPESDLVRFLNANAEPAQSRVLDIEFGSLPTDRFAPLGIGSPQALTHRIAMPRGYNPLDVRHFRQYLHSVLGSSEKVLGMAPVSQPIVPNFPRTHRPLWNLLNVRWLVCFDDYRLNPVFKDDPGHALKDDEWRFAAQFADPPAVPALPPQRPDPLPRALVFENLRAAPRAFVVPRAEAMPEDELAALLRSDLRQSVLLHTDEPIANRGGSARPVAIREYSANRVAVDLEGGDGGWLVLGEVWFPGWTCHIDGEPVPVHRANQAFRAVAIPPGAKEAVFRFEPESYRLGWWISVASAASVVVACGATFRRRRREL